jgi:NADH dehydrogenase
VNLIDAATSTGARFVLTSICGAAADHPVDLFRAKYAAEQYLRSSSTPWTIVRAPAYLETWQSVLAETAGSSGRPLVFGRGEQPILFARAADVAEVVVAAATDATLLGQTVEVPGEPMTMNELARALQEERGWHGSLRHVPRAALRTLAIVAAPVKPAFARQNRSALAMDTGRAALVGARTR